MHTVIQTGVFLADCRRAGLAEEDITAIVTAIAADPRNALKKELAAFAADYLANVRKCLIALKRRTP